MKPVYFPFTYISGEMIESLRGIAGPFAVFQPVQGDEPASLKGFGPEGGVELRFPVQGGEEQVREAARRFKNWAASHEGHLEAFKAITEHSFYNEDFASEIKTEILGAKTQQEQAGPVFNARLFLKISQEFDSQADEVGRSLKSTEDRWNRMFRELGEETRADIAPAGRHVSEDFGKFRTEGRIISYLRLMSRDKTCFRVLITPSRAVFDYMLEFVPGARAVKTIERVPAGSSTGEQLGNYARELCTSEDPESISIPEFSAEDTPGSIDLTAAVLPASSPSGLLNIIQQGGGSSNLEENMEARMALLFMETA